MISTLVPPGAGAGVVVVIAAFVDEISEVLDRIVVSVELVELVLEISDTVLVEVLEDAIVETTELSEDISTVLSTVSCTVV